MANQSGYRRSEFVEFAQLFISDGETINIGDNPETFMCWDESGCWVQGMFKVTNTMVDRYRRLQEEDRRQHEEYPVVEGVTDSY